MRPIAAALTIAAMLGTAVQTNAAVTVSTPGAKTINLDTRFGGPSQTFTTIDAPSPRISEGAAGDIATSITINAPPGNAFAFSVVAPTTATPIAPSNIVLGPATVFPFTITIPVITPSTTPGPIEINNIRMQPTGCIVPGLFNVPVTTDAGGAGDLSGATLITITLRAGPTVASYALASNSPKTGGTPITVTLSARDGCGNLIPNAAVPGNITLGCQVNGLVTWTNGAPFALSNVNAMPNTATIAAASVFDATGRGTFSVTNNQPCAENTMITATHAGGPGTATTPLAISWTNSNADTDGDGVIDCLDNCPNTPACAAVDAAGCPIDSDGDGVLDCQDACPNTPACASVNETGCPTDGDADGIADGCDACPGTLAGDPVDAIGCSTADEDGDGVLNDADACRGTPACAIASVGANGCPTDADGDGLFDGCDNCPGSNDLTDTDADGIPDCLDPCPLVGDSDADGVQDCQDGCPADTLKIAPGACGCGVPDTDTDADGIPDCLDPCPLVGDSDADGVQDCQDGCPADTLKIAPGACGCGVPDTDTDVDGIPDCLDPCPLVGDSDADGVQDCQDGCPADPLKLDPGVCGCGGAEVDTDNDGVIDCVDACPNTPACASVNQTGCPTDSDADGVADGCDLCPGTLAGDPVDANGCSTADEDGDGVLNDADACRGTPACAIASVGANGCPTDADGDGLFDGCDNCPGSNDLTDTDADGIPDCLDACPLVGDSDADGVQDCQDGCPADPLKIAPGTCGCGMADADTDGDGIPDCVDPCPNVGDSDGDGVQNCQDRCPNDATKRDPGACGCGNAETDTDGDGVADCVDGCPNDPAKRDAGACGCGNADSDANGDGIPDCLPLPQPAPQPTPQPTPSTTPGLQPFLALTPILPGGLVCGIGFALPTMVMFSAFLLRIGRRRRRH